MSGAARLVDLGLVFTLLCKRSALRMEV